MDGLTATRVCGAAAANETGVAQQQQQMRVLLVLILMVVLLDQTFWIEFEKLGHLVVHALKAAIKALMNVYDVLIRYPGFCG